MGETASDNMTGVVCLFCGIETEIFQHAKHRRPDREASALIVRCQHCCKESRYLASEVCDFPKMASEGALRSPAAAPIE